MCQVIEKYAVLQMIEAFGFCRFVFRKFGFDIERGLILVVEDTWQAGEIADAFCSTSAAVLVKWRKMQMVRPLNFQMGIYLYGKSDREEWIQEFLLEKDFLPVVIVAGIVPEALFEKGYIFKLEVTSQDICEFRMMYKKMQSNILEYSNAVFLELKNLKSSRIAKKYYTEKYANASQMIVATGVVWKMVIREKNDEETTDAWLKSYCEYLVSKLKSMGDFTGKYAVQKAVRKCIFDYVKQYDVQIAKIDEFSITDKTIFADVEYYYFPEFLLKEICRPLTNTISFLQLKSEMFSDGILVCNDGQKQNYTVKVTCFDADKNQYTRKRFLKLRKECLLTYAGIPLEDCADLSTNREVTGSVN